MNTKAIICEAAFSLFKEFPFDAITVQMILNRAEVSRKTFYKYFSDKYELMELFYKRFMDQNIRENYDGHNWDEILCALYDFVELDLPYFRNVKDISGQGSFWDFLRDYSYAFYSSVKLHNEQRDRLTEDEHLTIYMIVDGQMAALKQLIEGKVTLGRTEFSRVLNAIVPSSYKEIQTTVSPYEFTPSTAF